MPRLTAEEAEKLRQAHRMAEETVQSCLEDYQKAVRLEANLRQSLIEAGA